MVSGFSAIRGSTLPLEKSVTSVFDGEEIEDTPVGTVPCLVDGLQHGLGGKAQLGCLHLHLIGVVIAVGFHEILMAVEGEGSSVQDDAGIFYPFHERRDMAIASELTLNRL